MIHSAHYDHLCQVSAPAKAILSGEHAVVYGKDAIAIAIDLRCTAVVERRARMGSALVIETAMHEGAVSIEEETMQTLSARMGKCYTYEQFQRDMGKAQSSFSRTTHFKLALFFKQNHLSWAQWTEQRQWDYLIRVKSDIPIGRCLGSSAAFNTVLATAFLILFQFFPSPITTEAKERVNAISLSFQAVQHGNPSGIDNYVSVNGGVILYNKEKQPKFRQLLTAAENLKHMRVGVVDSGIDKNTKVAVGIVREKYNSDEASRLKVEEIGCIATQIVALLENSTFNSAAVEQVMKLASRNHALLRDLGVSHPKIEEIVQRWSQLGWSGKITGSGMGGCVLLLSQSAQCQEVTLTPIDNTGLRVQ